MFSTYKYSFLQRFLTYVRIDTQSDPASSSTPSTEKQKNLGRLLLQELKEMGVKDSELDEYGYVYASIPANTDKKVPVICFCSHMDTSPDSSGTGVKPIIHKNYQGQDLVLPDDPAQVIRMAEHPDLKNQIGNDIITASGTTLLGADDKAGLAEIMDAINFLLTNPEIKHGEIRLLFTPDEEIGRGVDKADLVKLGADFAYTVDGETLGSLENETFSADGAVLQISGTSAHPGFAKGKMQSAIKIISEIISNLPKDLSPENTSGREGFIHPISIKGSVEEAAAELILRDFDNEKLKQHGETLKAVVEKITRLYPGTSFNLKISEQYRNMKQVLQNYPQTVLYAQKAMKRAGITPKLQSIRGGTDGSRLSFLGLPCPNIFAGGHAFHSRQEWISVQDMEKAVQTIVNLAVIWEEES